MAKKIFLVLLTALMGLAPSGWTGQGSGNDPRIKEILEPLRVKHGLPAMAAAVVTGKGLQFAGVVGVRKKETDVQATLEDLWHLGSDTKAMTAAMIGALVEKRRLDWETRVVDIFPDLPPASPAALKEATLLHLLSHRSGLPGDITWALIPRAGSTRDQRRAVLKTATGLRVPPLKEDVVPGFLYSNLGYVIAGAMAEQSADTDWEELMADTIFKPLGMTSAGFGGLGTPGDTDQPWPHLPSGEPAPENGPAVDNPPVLGPAGTVHCTLSDWAKFAADQLKGGRGEPALLKPGTYKKLHTPPFPGGYALGWATFEREWAGGTMLSHNGSNTMNFAAVYMAPAKNLAILVVTNQGGSAANEACNEAAAEIVGRFGELGSKRIP